MPLFCTLRFFYEAILNKENSGFSRLKEEALSQRQDFREVGILQKITTEGMEIVLKL